MSYLWIAAAVVGALLVAATGVGGMWVLTRSTARLVARNASSGWREEKDVARLFGRALGLVFATVLVVSLIPWALVVSTVGTMADQFFRNTVNQWMSGPDLFRRLAVDQEEYERLPLRWRQALAEIAYRRGDEDETLRQLVSRLSVEDIETLDVAAQYALGGALVYARNGDSGAAVWGPSNEEMAHLEERGLAMNARIPFVHRTVRSGGGPAGGDVSDELVLVGQQFALRLRALAGGDGTARVSFVELTDLGRTLIRAAQRPTNLEYLCRLRSQYQSPGLSAEIWSTSDESLHGDRFRMVSELPDACGGVADSGGSADGSAGGN